MLRCKYCEGELKPIGKKIYVKKYHENIPAWKCMDCGEGFPESDFFRDKEFILDKYSFRENDKDKDDEIFDQAFDDWQEDSMNFVIDIYNEINITEYAILKDVLLDYYDFQIEDFVENLSDIYGHNYTYERFSPYSYRIRKLCDIHKIKSPLNWYGGKYYIKSDIINLFPQHYTYCEVFGGAAHVLFAKKPSPIEVYNDINEGLYLFFKFLRNPEKRWLLLEQLQLTPYSRREFEESQNWMNEKDELEKVRKFYIATMQSRNCNGGWAYAKGYSARGISGTVSRWLGNIDTNIIPAIDRLREVQVENLNFEQCIKKYDSTKTLFYLDPPYLSETRKQKKSYLYEMNDSDHKKLIEILLEIKGKAILSGYNNEIYKRLIDFGWRKIFLKSYVKNSVNSYRRSNRGMEYVWINFDVGKQKIINTFEKGSMSMQLNIFNC